MLENPQQSWILDPMLWIPDPLSVQLGFQIPISSRIPDSLSCSGFHSPRILDSTTKIELDSGFHVQKYPRFLIPLHRVTPLPPL